MPIVFYRRKEAPELEPYKCNTFIPSDIDNIPDRTKFGLLTEVFNGEEVRNAPIYKEVCNGIKIYDNTTINSREQYAKKIAKLEEINGSNLLFTPLVPSTLTAEGKFKGVKFIETELFPRLKKPTGYIIGIGYNFGELFNADYELYVPQKKSGRGRRPNLNKKKKRRAQGGGKYFISQISFYVYHPILKTTHPIKLFRNGRFQVPGIRSPNMTDLIIPILILKEYLAEYFEELADVDLSPALSSNNEPITESRENDIIEYFSANMRNYKTKLINNYFHVDLNYIEHLVAQEKKIEIENKEQSFGLSIAEYVYNPDRCFSLIIKFYRPTTLDPTKKITVKLLKKGKINFDGGNSQQEVAELYLWLNYLYYTNINRAVLDVRTITNVYDKKDYQNIEDDVISIYSECGDNNTKKSKRARKKRSRKINALPQKKKVQKNNEASNTPEISEEKNISDKILSEEKNKQKKKIISELIPIINK
jgi:hypothetical protein